MEKKYSITYTQLDNPLQLNDFYVYQIGRAFCNEVSYCENHFHQNWYELTIVTDGEGVIYTNNTPVPVKKGDIYLSCIYDIHAIKSNAKNPLKYDFCAFLPKNQTLKRGFKTLASKLSNEHSRLFQSNRISALCPMALNEMQDLSKELSPVLLNSLMLLIAEYTLRILNKTQLSDNSLISDKKVLCYQIMDYISENVENLRTLTILADVFHYSYNYLSTVFKQTTDIHLVDFYNLQRLTLAKTLILENKLSLEKIAEKINYSTPFALSKAFKKQFNLSPAELKRTAKHE